MANWEIININEKNGSPVSPALQEQWDDGLKFIPSEAGFTDSLIKAYAGVGNYNYIGTPNWEGDAP